MYRSAILTMCLVGALATPCHAQNSDGWDYADTPAVKVASVSFGSGQSIAIRCAGGELDVMILGLPVETGGGNRLLEVGLGGADLRRQTWLNHESAAVVYSARPAFSARYLRGGGQLTLRMTPSEAQPVIRRFQLKLPTDGLNIDRVLEVCSVPLTDARDQVFEIEPPLSPPPNLQTNLWEQLPHVNFPGTAANAGVAAGRASVSCLVGERGDLGQCRVERESPKGVGFGRETVRAFERARVRLTPGVEPGQIVIIQTMFAID